MIFDLNDYGFDNTFFSDNTSTEIPARIIAMYKGRYEVVCKYGVSNAVLRGAFLYSKRGKNGTHVNPEKVDMPVTGDFVLLKYNDIGDSLISSICTRKTQFSRTDFSGHAAGYVKTMKEQVLATNFDTVCILSSLNKEFNKNRIARYLSAAVHSGAEPVVILTKKDKATTDSVVTCTEEVHKIAPNIPVFAVSALTGDGMESLSSILIKGKTLVFIGSSGVGKSTLANALMGQEVMNTGGIREDDDKGRHTTTHRELIRCNNGVLILDTPGIRELGMWDAVDGIEDIYSDIKDLLTQCRFSNCSHNSEPGCAIQEAIVNGTLSKERWKEYTSLMSETTWASKKMVINGRKRTIHYKVKI